MGLLGNAYSENSTNAYSNYDYSGSNYSSTGKTSRTNSTTATKSKIAQTVKDVAQGYSSDLNIVEYYLRSGEIDSAMKLKDSIFDDISDVLKSEYNFNVTDSQISSILDQAYTSVNGQTTQATVEENASSSFMTGLKEGVPLLGLLANGNSKSESMARLAGTEVSSKEEWKEGIGAAVSGAASGVVGTAAVGAGAAILTGAEFGSVFGPVGIAVGAGIGLAAGLVQYFMKKTN